MKYIRTVFSETVEFRDIQERENMMTDEKRLRLMINLARFREKYNNTAFRINRKDRSDYLGASLIGNFVLTTIAYFLLLFLFALTNMDMIIGHLNDLHYRTLIAGAIVGYLIFLGLYSVLVSTLAKLRYARAERKMAIYLRQLERLEQMYRQEEKEEEAMQSFARAEQEETDRTQLLRRNEKNHE